MRLVIYGRDPRRKKCEVTRSSEARVLNLVVQVEPSAERTRLRKTAMFVELLDIVKGIDIENVAHAPCRII